MRIPDQIRKTKQTPQKKKIRCHSKEINKVIPKLETHKGVQNRSQFNTDTT